MSPKRDTVPWCDYFLYGLRMHSNHPIPGLAGTSTTTVMPGDVRVWLNATPPEFPEILSDNEQSSYVSEDTDEHGTPILRITCGGHGDYFRLLFSDGVQFLVDRAGTALSMTAPANTTIEDAASYLVGPIMAFVLSLRNVTCLHASAIAIENQAIALLGSSGAGKSTTAAMFARLGFPVLSDDVVPLRDRHDHFLAQPGYPCLRLWPSSVDALFGSPEALPCLTPTWEKRGLDLTTGDYRFHTQESPLKAIYILDERCDRAPVVENISVREGLLALVANSYTAHVINPQQRALEFQVLSRVAKHVPLRRVKAHTDPARLPELCAAIVEDFYAQTRGAKYPNLIKEDGYVQSS